MPEETIIAMLKEIRKRFELRNIKGWWQNSRIRIANKDYLKPTIKIKKN